MHTNNKIIRQSYINLVKQNQFLEINNATSNGFSNTDTQQLFNKNLNTCPIDWYYRNNTISYAVNKQGFRTAEFDTIDWRNSVVIFGCSNVFGVGLDDQDTISFRLSAILNMPVVNLGIGGTSIEYALHNSVILKSGYPEPKGVVQIWSGCDRTTYYRSDRVETHGSWSLMPGNYMDAWAKDADHAAIHALFASKISKELWKGTAKYYETSFFSNTAIAMDIEKITIIDKARDLIHPGRQTAQQVAIKIAN